MIRRKQGKTGARGYGATHQALRKRLEPQVAAGLAFCARCGGQIRPGEKWHLDHADDDRGDYLGPSHASCNIAASNRSPRRKGSGSCGPVSPDRRQHTKTRRKEEIWEADLEFRHPFYGPTGEGASKMWSDEHMTREAWVALGPEERRRRRAM